MTRAVKLSRRVVGCVNLSIFAMACERDKGFGTMVTYNGDILNEISSNVPDHVVNVVVMYIAARLPETDISVARGILGVRLESANFSMHKLRQKPGVFRPEQPDIGNGEQNHGDTLKPKAKGPTHFVCDTYDEISATGLQDSVEVIPARSSVDCSTTPQPSISSHFPRKNTSTS